MQPGPKTMSPPPIQYSILSVPRPPKSFLFNRNSQVHVHGHLDPEADNENTNFRTLFHESHTFTPTSWAPASHTLEAVLWQFSDPRRRSSHFLMVQDIIISFPSLSSLDSVSHHCNYFTAHTFRETSSPVKSNSMPTANLHALELLPGCGLKESTESCWLVSF